MDTALSRQLARSLAALQRPVSITSRVEAALRHTMTTEDLGRALPDLTYGQIDRALRGLRLRGRVTPVSGRGPARTWRPSGARRFPGLRKGVIS